MPTQRWRRDRGYYSNFVGDVEYHMDDPWYNVRDLIRILRRMRRLDLSTPEDRYKAVCWLNGMECTVPYGPISRFPYNSFYITEARGNWGQALTKLKKMLAENCFIKFEEEKPKSLLCCRKFKRNFPENDSDCCRLCCAAVENVCDLEIYDYYDLNDGPEGNCPITSDACNKCLGPDPPSCCPKWCGKYKVKKLPKQALKNYLKRFQDIIEKMMKDLGKKDCVFSRKKFERHYKVKWKRCNNKSHVIKDNEDSNSGDYLCEDCCEEENYGKYQYRFQREHDDFYEAGPQYPCRN